MREIQEHKIKIYEFPETDDEEESKLVKKIKVCLVTIVNDFIFFVLTLGNIFKIYKFVVIWMTRWL